MKKKLIAGMLVAGLLFSNMGCGENTAQRNSQEKKEPLSKGTVNLMEDMEKNEGDDGNAAGNAVVEGSSEANMETFRQDTTDFSIAILRENLESGQKNVMISPLSVLAALSMTANGAEGNTLVQMQQVLGQNQDLEQLNVNIKTWTDGLVNTENTSLKIANSIWFKDDANRIQVQQDFLKKNSEYYNADIFKAAFDEGTLAEINSWVADKTEDRVKDILNEVPEDAVMYLVNALAFDAEWQEIYFENQIRDGVFHMSADEEENVSFMYGEERIFLEDELATGFIKPYKEGYSFIAILPNEGISPSEYISSLTGEKFLQLLEGQKTATVYTAIPKFEKEYEIELKDILMALGMNDAFDADKADFSKLGVSADGNIYMNRVLHKTFISVDERGTEAGAATVVEMTCETAIEEAETYRVYLERPFVYAIVDNETNIPLFMGTVDSIGAQN